MSGYKKIIYVCIAALSSVLGYCGYVAVQPRYQLEPSFADYHSVERYIDIDMFYKNQGERDYLADVLFYPLTGNANDHQARFDRVRKNGYVLRKHAPIRVDEKINWSDDRGDVNWHFKVNSWAAIMEGFNAHEATGDIEYLKIIKPVIFDWINFNVVENKPNDKKWYDMAAGSRAYMLAYFFDHYPLGSLSDEELKNLLITVDMHADALSRPELLARGNHALFQLSGLAALCRAVPEIKRCETALPYANEKFEQLVNAQFTQEGIHIEHAAQYHPWAIAVISNMLATKVFERSDYPALDKAHEHFKWFLFPGGRSVRNGDTDQYSAKKYEKNLGIGNEINIFNEHLGLFKESGYVFFRKPDEGGIAEQDSYLFFHAGFHSTVHKHADDMAFEWYESGSEILVDSGKYTYNSNAWRDYFVSTAAHNTVEIDGVSDKIRDQFIYGSAIESANVTDQYFHSRARLNRKQFDVVHQRDLVLLPKHALIVVDSLAADKPHKYTQWFHYHPSFRVVPDEAGRGYQARNEKLSVYHSFSDGLSSAQFHGQTEPFIQGWTSYDYQQKEPNHVIGLSLDAKNAVIVSAFGLGEPLDIIQSQSEIIVCNSYIQTLSAPIEIAIGKELTFKSCAHSQDNLSD